MADARFDKIELQDGSLELVGHSEGRIISLGDLITKHAIDLRFWEVAQFNPNSWETHFNVNDVIERRINFQAKARLIPNSSYNQVDSAIKDLLKTLVAVAPKREAIKHIIRGPDNFMFEIDFMDIHMGMLSWAQETGEDPFDSEKCTSVVMTALEHLLRRASGFPITKFLLPVGNDLLHADTTIKGSGGSTAAGTPLDVDTRHLKIFRNAVRLMVMAIDILREIAPVEVVICVGNHDENASKYVGEVLSAWYRNDPEVTVNNSAKQRKYAQFGVSLLGFTHGDKEKLETLPLLMASEQREAWAATEYHVWHTGHFHKRKSQTTITTDTYNGVEVRTIPSLIPPDAWHASKGFVGGGRSAEAHLFEKSAGPAGYFSYNLPRKTPGKNMQLIMVE